MAKPLKLSAQDAEDLAVISAALQDAVLKVGEMRYLPKQRRFAAVLNRFMWETTADEAAQGIRTANGGQPLFQRVKTGVHFDGVLAVKSQNIRLEDKSSVLALLALEFTPGEEGAGAITLVFAGGGVISIEVECIEGTMSDISAPWPTPHLPSHEDTQ